MFIILIRMSDKKLQAISDSDMIHQEEWIYEYETEEDALEFTKNSALLHAIPWEIVEVGI